MGARRVVPTSAVLGLAAWQLAALRPAVPECAVPQCVARRAVRHEVRPELQVVQAPPLALPGLHRV